MHVRRLLLSLAAAPIAIAALFSIERTAAGNDAAQYWVMAGRLASTGDPFYVAAVDHKGPLWVWVYRVGYAISGEQKYFWFLMAAAVMAFAALVGWVVHRIIEDATADSTVARTAGVVTVGFLWFGPESYSQILFGRNITVALTALAVLAVVRALDDRSRRATTWLIPAGAALGLASSTVLTTLAPTVMVALALAAVGTERRQAIARALVLLASAAVALAAVPLWYVARGAGTEFRTYFWDYSRMYSASDATLFERGLSSVNELIRYHIAHPYLLVGPIAVAVLVWWAATRPGRPDRSTRVGLVLAAWWIGEAVSVAAPGRWYTHYWILLVIPTAALGGVVVAHARSYSDAPPRTMRAWRRTSTAVGLMAVVGVALLSTPRVLSGAETALTFDGATANDQQRWDHLSLGLTSFRATTAALTEPGEEVYVWSRSAAVYLLVDRPAATRFDRQTWQTGQVWGSDVIAHLPRAWDELMEDFDQQRPRLVIERRDPSIPSDSPLATLLAEEYEVIYEPGIDWGRVWRRIDDVSSPPPSDLASRDDASDPNGTCLALDAAPGSTVIVGEPGVEVAFEIGADLVTMRSLGTLDTLDRGPAVSSERTGDGLVLHTKGDEAVLWDGDMIVAATSLSGGVGPVVFSDGIAPVAVACRPR